MYVSIVNLLKNQRRKLLFGFVTVFIITLTTISYTSAAGQNSAVSLEAENGTISGAASVQSDPSASNGQYIVFNAIVTPTPTSTPSPTPTLTPTPTNTPTPTPTPVTLGLSNLTVFDTANAKNYSFQTNIQVGNTLYGDRKYTIKTLPAGLAGSQWVRTANNSKTWNAGATLLSFTVNRQAIVSIAIDKRLKKPTWMDSTWVDTNTVLIDAETGVNTIKFEIYQKTFPQGSIALGPNQGVTASDMYVVIVQ